MDEDELYGDTRWKTWRELMNAEEWLEKGYTFLEFGRYRNALRAFEKVIELDPQYVRGWIGKGAALYNLEEYRDALTSLEKAIELDPQYVYAWRGKGDTLYTLEKYKDAIKAYQKAIELDPHNVTAWSNTGTVLYTLEKYKDAIKAYQKAIESDPHRDLSYIDLGRLYLVLEDLENASKRVDEVLSINSRNTSALVLKGRIKIEEKDYDGAIEYFKEAIRSDLGNHRPLLWNVYAHYLDLESNFDMEGREYQEEIGVIIRKLEKINELNKKGKGELRALSLYFLGYFYYKNRDISRAERKLTECIMIGPKKGFIERFFKPQPSIQVLALELLDSIWVYKKKSIWSWWIFSPIYCWKKRVLFIFLLSSIFLLLFFHPFIPQWFSTEINWFIYAISIVFLIFLLLSPFIQYIRAEGIEVELHSPTSLEPFLSPLGMEKMIDKEEYLHSYRIGTLQESNSTIRNLFKAVPP